jgi:hypothetical protein
VDHCGLQTSDTPIISLLHSSARYLGSAVIEGRLGPPLRAGTVLKPGYPKDLDSSNRP